MSFAVLAGLTSTVPALAFEYLPGALSQVEVCTARLLDLGPYVFNWSPGETSSSGIAGLVDCC